MTYLILFFMCYVAIMADQMHTASLSSLSPESSRPPITYGGLQQNSSNVEPPVDISRSNKALNVNGSNRSGSKTDNQVRDQDKNSKVHQGSDNDEKSSIGPYSQFYIINLEDDASKFEAPIRSFPRGPRIPVAALEALSGYSLKKAEGTNDDTSEIIEPDNEAAITGS